VQVCNFLRGAVSGIQREAFISGVDKVWISQVKVSDYLVPLYVQAFCGLLVLHRAPSWRLFYFVSGMWITCG
jgi:hypothetical protein